MQECGHSGGTAFALGKEALGGSLGLMECLPYGTSGRGLGGQLLSLANVWFLLSGGCVQGRLGKELLCLPWLAG